MPCAPRAVALIAARQNGATPGCGGTPTRPRSDRTPVSHQPLQVKRSPGRGHAAPEQSRCGKAKRPKCPHWAPRDQTMGGRGRSTPGAHMRPGCQGPYALRRLPRARWGPRSGPHDQGRGNSAGGAGHDLMKPKARQPWPWPRRSRAFCVRSACGVLALCWYSRQTSHGAHACAGVSGGSKSDNP